MLNQHHDMPEFYMKEKVKELMLKLPFVQWDRFCEEKNCITTYGWIEREDSYKDFIVLSVNDDMSYSWLSSSVRKDEEIKAILETGKMGYAPCQRVEWSFEIPNMIKLLKK